MIILLIFSAKDIL